MSKVYVFYKLSEEGQKAAVLLGVNAEKEQHEEIMITMTPGIMEQLRVNCTGTPWINFGVTNTFKRPEKDYCFNSNDAALSLDWPILAEEDFLKALDMLKAFRQKQEEKKAAERETEILKWLLRPALEWFSYHSLSSGYTHNLRVPGPIQEDPRIIALLPDAQRAADDEVSRRNAEVATEAETKKAEEEASKATAQRAAAERLLWIENSGTEHLKRIVEAGYPYQKKYVEERKAIELGSGWYVDWKDSAQWDTKVSPSMEALELEKDMKAKGHKAEIVWLKKDGQDHSDETGDEQGFSPCEAAIILGYLGKYDVIRQM